jgi:hypothetical protein
MKPLLNGFTVFFVLLSCIVCQPKSTSNQEKFFDLESFIDKLVGELSSDNYRLHKQTVIDDSVETVTIIPDSPGWHKELSIFKTADIHKPGLREYYEKSVLDTGNVIIENYRLREKAESETLFLQIERIKKTMGIRLIKASQRTNNPIYYSRRKLYMEFHFTDDDGMLLDSFAVQGFQKMVLQDSVKYFTSGKILVR